MFSADREQCSSDPHVAMRDLDRLFMDCMPAETIDVTDGGYFSRPITVHEIAAVKVRLQDKGTTSATGADAVSYAQVLGVDNEDLCLLFQKCIDDRDAPAQWLTTILAAAEKRGKDPARAESYRNIGLESCLLKVLTLIIDRRMREWAEAVDRIPPEQNGFRPGYRTINNVFTLRAAIEKARANGSPLWVAYVDLRNAFPSVDQSVMWRKLQGWGVAGPLVDWLRMIYARMQYVVRYAGELSESFRALAGILIGDPASPVLWILFFADFQPPPHMHDIFLGLVRVAYLAQADDILFMSMSREGLQAKLDALLTWCRRNGLEINVTKTVVMIFGPIPDPLPRLYLDGRPLSFVATSPYVGVHITSTKPHIFATHREAKAAAARNIANTVLSLESYIDCIPPRIARLLYLSHIDPHLVYGCEVDLDVDQVSYAQLQDLQLTYIRRALLLSQYSPQAIAYALSGLWPLRYRRALLVLRFLRYILKEQPAYPAAALRESFQLVQRGHSSWWSDLCHAMASLPVGVPVTHHVFPTLASVDAMSAALEQSLATYISGSIRGSRRFQVYEELHLVTLPASPTVAQLFAAPAYLSLPRNRRRAMTKLVASEHTYAVQVLRYQPGRVDNPDWRVCRFCRRRSMTEDERHVLFDCEAAPLHDLREDMFAELERLQVRFVRVRAALDPWALVRYLSAKPDLLSTFAGFVHATLELCKVTPLLRVLDQTTYDALLP